MMKFMSPLHNDVTYSSIVWHDSQTLPGARYAIRRVSLAQRIELTSRAREVVLKNEFLKAGDAPDGLEAALSELLVQKLYIEWGLSEITGLVIDGNPATPETVVEKGPEALTQEIVSVIREQLELSEDKRKNF